MINNKGQIYEKNQKQSIRKSIGQYYTPGYIVKYILNNTVDKADIVENPYIKVIDPSCGAGYFLLESYDLLKKKFIKNLDNLKDKYGHEIYIVEDYGEQIYLKGTDYWKEENIHYHLLKHCIFGADKDDYAVEITIEALMDKKLNSDFKKLNIVKCDSLIKWENIYDLKNLQREFKNIDSEEIVKELNISHKELLVLSEFWNNKFDYCVGNPPYIGHRQMDKEYKRWLADEYKNVFKDKSDISFCFFNRIIDILAPDGVCGIITSRYFMESPMGKFLRDFLKDNTKIIEILDFYGANIFKDIGVATAIYIFKRYENSNNLINVFKLKDNSYKFENTLKSEKILNTNIFENFKTKQNQLSNDRWVLLPDEIYEIYLKIENKGNRKLKDIVNSFQGIITGCDKAFILSEDKATEKRIEKELLKKWIKNKNIESYNISKSELKLIYSNLIYEPDKHSNAIDFIGIYSKKLRNRRECKNGIRKWYELQWGRKIGLFQQPKIIFPYKSNTNRFAIDNDNHFFSADIYGLILKDEYKSIYSLEYLIGLLNSKVYEFYFKLFAKQMGKGIYDYYPNSLLDLAIISDTIINKIENRVDKILNLANNNLDNDLETQNKIRTIKKEIDNIIMDYFEFNSKEREIIKQNS